MNIRASPRPVRRCYSRKAICHVRKVVPYHWPGPLIMLRETRKFYHIFNSNRIIHHRHQTSPRRNTIQCIRPDSTMATVSSCSTVSFLQFNLYYFHLLSRIWLRSAASSIALWINAFANIVCVDGRGKWWGNSRYFARRKCENEIPIRTYSNWMYRNADGWIDIEWYFTTLPDISWWICHTGMSQLGRQWGFSKRICHQQWWWRTSERKWNFYVEKDFRFANLGVMYDSLHSHMIWKMKFEVMFHFSCT